MKKTLSFIIVFTLFFINFRVNSIKFVNETGFELFGYSILRKEKLSPAEFVRISPYDETIKNEVYDSIQFKRQHEKFYVSINLKNFTSEQQDKLIVKLKRDPSWSNDISLTSSTSSSLIPLFELIWQEEK